MIIAKAIEILELLTRDREVIHLPDTFPAIKLLIEAGKRIENCRQHSWLPIYGPLPGESMPERDMNAAFYGTKKTNRK